MKGKILNLEVRRIWPVRREADLSEANSEAKDFFLELQARGFNRDDNLDTILVDAIGDSLLLFPSSFEKISQEESLRVLGEQKRSRFVVFLSLFGPDSHC